MKQLIHPFPVSIRVKPTGIPWPVLSAIILVGSVLVVLIFGLLAYQVYFLERVHLGVRVDGIDAGTLTRPELRRLVQNQSNRLLDRQITLIGETDRWTMTAAELGASVNAEQTINAAFAVGRQGNLISDLQTQWQLMQMPVNIAPNIRFDSGPANQMLHDIAASSNRPARDAALAIDPNLTVVVTPPEMGRSVDLAATRAAIEQVIVGRRAPTINLILDYTQPKITEVEAARFQAQSFISRPLVFTHHGRAWSLEPHELAGMIAFDTVVGADGIGRVVSYLKREPLQIYFQNLAKFIDQAPVDARYDLDEETWTLQPIVNGQDGQTLDVTAAVDLVAARLAHPDSTELVLPVRVEAAAVPMASAELLGIKELVSSSTSYFKGSSEGRVQNIIVSAAKFHGLVVPPGGLFSFNEHLGEVNEENGFVESLIIQGDRTAVGIGGGVCQVSTTAFRAAFFGGFEIVERWAHGYRVSWYETGSTPGLDATIFSPLVDFKFRNDTASYILIQTETDVAAGTVTFNFYGTNPNRTVEVSEPIETNFVRHGPAIFEEDPSLAPGERVQVDWAKDGVDVTVQRTVMEGETILHQDTIFSRYQPWQAVYKIGPEKAGQPAGRRSAGQD